jgi:phosphoribosyl-ATP pyrophosphohydrolase/phosphoribosyl-AMP cyclohydrolase
LDKRGGEWSLLNLVDIKNDCDGDTLLIQAKPVGPTCHTGADTCWQTENKADYGFISLSQLEKTEEKADSESYVASLFN